MGRHHTRYERFSLNNPETNNDTVRIETLKSITNVFKAYLGMRRTFKSKLKNELETLPQFKSFFANFDELIQEYVHIFLFSTKDLYENTDLELLKEARNGLTLIQNDLQAFIKDYRGIHTDIYLIELQIQFLENNIPFQRQERISGVWNRTLENPTPEQQDFIKELVELILVVGISHLYTTTGPTFLSYSLAPLKNEKNDTKNDLDNLIAALTESGWGNKTKVEARNLRKFLGELFGLSPQDSFSAENIFSILLAENHSNLIAKMIHQIENSSFTLFTPKITLMATFTGISGSGKSTLIENMRPDLPLLLIQDYATQQSNFRELTVSSDNTGYNVSPKHDVYKLGELNSTIFGPIFDHNQVLKPGQQIPNYLGLIIYACTVFAREISNLSLQRRYNVYQPEFGISIQALQENKIPIPLITEMNIFHVIASTLAAAGISELSENIKRLIKLLPIDFKGIISLKTPEDVIQQRFNSQGELSGRNSEVSKRVTAYNSLILEIESLLRENGTHIFEVDTRIPGYERRVLDFINTIMLEDVSLMQKDTPQKYSREKALMIMSFVDMLSRFEMEYKSYTNLFLKRRNSKSSNPLTGGPNIIGEQLYTSANKTRKEEYTDPRLYFQWYIDSRSSLVSIARTLVNLENLLTKSNNGVLDILKYMLIRNQLIPLENFQNLIFQVSTLIIIEVRKTPYYASDFNEIVSENADLKARCETMKEITTRIMANLFETKEVEKFFHTTTDLLEEFKYLYNEIFVNGSKNLQLKFWFISLTTEYLQTFNFVALNHAARLPIYWDIFQLLITSLSVIPRENLADTIYDEGDNLIKDCLINLLAKLFSRESTATDLIKPYLFLPPEQLATQVRKNL